MAYQWLVVMNDRVTVLVHEHGFLNRGPQTWVLEQGVANMGSQTGGCEQGVANRGSRTGVCRPRVEKTFPGSFLENLGGKSQT